MKASVVNMHFDVAVESQSYDNLPITASFSQPEKRWILIQHKIINLLTETFPKILPR